MPNLSLPKLHQLTAPAKTSPKKRVGRGIGSKCGKTSTRGHRGQWARTGGAKVRAGFEGGQTVWYRRLPKKGFKTTRTHVTYALVESAIIEQHYQDGEVVNNASLFTKHLIHKPNLPVKIVFNLPITKKIEIQVKVTKQVLAKSLALVIKSALSSQT